MLVVVVVAAAVGFSIHVAFDIQSLIEFAILQREKYLAQTRFFFYYRLFCTLIADETIDLERPGEVIVVLREGDRAQRGNKRYDLSNIHRASAPRH